MEGGAHPPPTESRFGFFARLVGNDHIALMIQLGRDAETSHWRTLMARLDPIDVALGNLSTAADSAATQLAQLATQIAALSAGSVTDAEIAAKAAAVQAVADRVSTLASDIDAAIEPDAGEGEPTPTPEPTPEPEPAPEPPIV